MLMFLSVLKMILSEISVLRENVVRKLSYGWDVSGGGESEKLFKCDLCKMTQTRNNDSSKKLFKLFVL